MYGWINGCLEDLIIESYGIEIWNSIKSKAGITQANGDFFRSVNFDDETTYQLVNAASQLLSVPKDDLL